MRILSVPFSLRSVGPPLVDIPILQPFSVFALCKKEHVHPKQDPQNVSIAGISRGAFRVVVGLIGVALAALPVAFVVGIFHIWRCSTARFVFFGLLFLVPAPIDHDAVVTRRDPE